MLAIACVSVDTGTLCSQGDSLTVVFDTCSSSANSVPVSECTGAEVGGEWVLSTRYRETGDNSLPDCQVRSAQCPTPPAGMRVRLGDDDAVALDRLPACESAEM